MCKELNLFSNNFGDAGAAAIGEPKRAQMGRRHSGRALE